MWHPTQKFRRTAAGLEMMMEVRGTVEVVNWVLGFGDKAVILEPERLRGIVAQGMRHAAALYYRGDRQTDGVG